MNMFEIEKMPEPWPSSAIGSGWPSFSRLGTKVSWLHMDPHPRPWGDEEAGRLLEEVFAGRALKSVTGKNHLSVKDGRIVTVTDKGTLTSERILVAAGRKPVIGPLHLDRAGIVFSKKGITVDSRMRTSRPHIYAVGDCNGHSLLSHAAMHQGMLALMDAMSPVPMGVLKRERYVVPWAVFTQPEIAQVGMTEKEAREKGLKFQVVKKDFRSYGRTVADGRPEGFIKVITGPRGKIYGAAIVGEAASELIHEWTMAIQYKKRMHHIMMMQHAFPSISMINKMVAEDWMMEKMKSKWMQRLVKLVK